MEVEGVEPSSEKVSSEITTSVVYILIFARDLALDGADPRLVRVSFPAMTRRHFTAVSGLITSYLSLSGAGLKDDAAVIY
jgi:hypothetical protein